MNTIKLEKGDTFEDSDEGVMAESVHADGIEESYFPYLIQQENKQIPDVLFEIEDSISPRSQWERKNEIHVNFNSKVNAEISWLALIGDIDENAFYNEFSPDAGLGETRQAAIDDLVLKTEIKSFEETQLDGEQA
jgi:hypothetical protein